MSLADDLFLATHSASAKQPCTTGAWYLKLDDRDRQAVDSFLSDGGTVTALHRQAVRNGCSAAETRFRVHFRHECCCYPREAAA